LDQRWFNQNWLIGIYGYYEGMSYKWFALPLLRLNIGGELSGTRWGELTVNLYKTWFDKDKKQFAYDIGGISGKISFNEWMTSLKPFFAASYSWVKFNQEVESRGIPSVAVGVKWIINSALDIEGKYYIWDEYQNPHIGFQLK
jgi:hypothetical protein